MGADCQCDVARRLAVKAVLSTLCVVKAALISLTRTAAADLGPYGINVNAIAPGLTKTPNRQQRLGSDEAFFWVVSEGPMENLLHTVAASDDVAAAIVFLCLPTIRQITAQTLHRSGGFIV